MAYGDYDGPDKADKGEENGSCNRRRCQAFPALYYNHGSFKWYCIDCARDIGRANFHSWRADFPNAAHPMFETREALAARPTIPTTEHFNPATGSQATADQMAAVMLQHGTAEQRKEALDYAITTSGGEP